MMCFSTVSTQKNFFHKKTSSYTNLFATLAICLRLFVASVLSKLDALPTKTYKISRAIWCEFP